MNGLNNSLDLRSEICSLEVGRESSYGAGDAVECGRESSVVCASEDCSCCPCDRHFKFCPTCVQPFCESSDRTLWTCFSEHLKDGDCQREILRVPLGRLGRALDSGRHPRLSEFVKYNSDGLGHPLPEYVCRHFGFAVACLGSAMPDYNRDVLAAQKETRRLRRTKVQRIRRAAQRQGVSAGSLRAEKSHLSPFRNSTIHIVAGALVTLHWTGGWHHRENAEMLEIMGLARSQDFVPDRIEYLRIRNRSMFEMIESQAIAMRKAEKSEAK